MSCIVRTHIIQLCENIRFVKRVPILPNMISHVAKKGRNGFQDQASLTFETLLIK